MSGRSCHPHGPRWWPALLVLSLLFVAAPGALALPANPVPNSAVAPSFALYLGDYAGTEYTPVDPATLADLTNARPVTFTGVAPQLLLSADGTTAVTIRRTAAEPVTIDVRNGINGPEQRHFTVGKSAGTALLSRDGARLAIATDLTSKEEHWRIFDTHTGHLLATVVCTGQSPAPYLDLIGPDGHVLYHPFYDRPSTQNTTGTANQSAPKGPWRLRIAAYDLTTGKETSKVTVPGVVAGTWLKDPSASDPVAEIVQPAIALSPDGTRLAVIDADSTKVTLVDTKTLTIAGTHALHLRESAVHHFLRWLGLAPQTAEAKFMAGNQLSAVFAPDGQHLYLTGIETSVDTAKKTMTGKSLGMRRVDVTTGAITATALSDSQIATVLPSPDGRSLYVSGPATPFWENQTGQETWVLRRLGARTLTPLAERTFDSPTYLIIVPVIQHG